MQGYERDPRSLAKRAEAYLKSTGIADAALFGPENEFFIFDSVRFQQRHGRHLPTRSTRCRARGTRRPSTQDGNNGHRPGVKGGYFPVPPVDALARHPRRDVQGAARRSASKVEVHHHEVATGGQCEIGIGRHTLVKKADEVLMLKYVVQNVAHRYGKTATFMPKPLVGDNGSGMHVHQSLAEGRQERCSPATSTAACRRSRCSTSAASSSTPRRSTPSPTPAPTATSAWCRASRRR